MLGTNEHINILGYTTIIFKSSVLHCLCSFKIFEAVLVPIVPSQQHFVCAISAHVPSQISHFQSSKTLFEFSSFTLSFQIVYDSESFPKTLIVNMIV